VTVPQNLVAPLEVAVTSLGGQYTYFGIWWGSMDAYNTLTFTLGGTTVASYTGADIASLLILNPPLGNQTSGYTNAYVNFVGLPAFDGFKMSSTQFAFEADNIAIGNVPEPTSLILLGSGLLARVCSASASRRAEATFVTRPDEKGRTSDGPAFFSSWLGRGPAG